MTRVNVSISGALATVAGVRTIEVEASSISQVLDVLSSTFGKKFRDRLYDANGIPSRFINIYVNGRDYRFLKRLETELKEDDSISLIPAVSGG